MADQWVWQLYFADPVTVPDPLGDPVMDQRECIHMAAVTAAGLLLDQGLHILVKVCNHPLPPCLQGTTVPLLIVAPIDVSQMSPADRLAKGIPVGDPHIN